MPSHANPAGGGAGGGGGGGGGNDDDDSDEEDDDDQDVVEGLAPNTEAQVPGLCGTLFVDRPVAARQVTYLQSIVSTRCCPSLESDDDETRNLSLIT